MKESGEGRKEEEKRGGMSEGRRKRKSKGKLRSQKGRDIFERR